jgi:hypothetical protein
MIRLHTPMRELQEYHQTSFGADPDETVEEFLMRKSEERKDAQALLGYIRAVDNTI